MKDYSAAQIKRGLKAAITQFPREGSDTRKLFDVFNEFKGQVIDFGRYDKYLDMRIRYLKDFYGMDFVHKGKGQWIFIGEYIGSKYVSYENSKPLMVKLKVDLSA